MGGTSTDVCLIEDLKPLLATSNIIAGMPINTPQIDIHAVGAGGGSIAWVDIDGSLKVGPRSAGAVPGPACYGKGGTALTITDANVVLGRLGADAARRQGGARPGCSPAQALKRLAAELRRCQGARMAGGRRHPARGRDHGRRRAQDLDRAWL